MVAEETGLDYFEARYLSAAQGRFTSPDIPLLDQNPGDPQSWNLYSYVRNNPLIYTDPTGNDCVSVASSTSSGGAGTEVARVVQDTDSVGCAKMGGYWVDGTVTSARFAHGSLHLTGTTDGTNRTSASYGVGPGDGMLALQQGLQMADVLIRDAAKQMAVGAVIGGVGGAVIGHFAPQAIELAVSRLPVSRVFPALSRLSPKILRQMQTRGWTRAEIQQAFENGQQSPAVNRLRGGTPATRYVHRTTGKASRLILPPEK